MSLLTEQEITEIVREAARGSATRRDGSTSQRIAIAVEKVVLAKIKAQGPAAWAATSDDGIVEALGFNQSKSRFTVPLYRLPEGDLEMLIDGKPVEVLETPYREVAYLRAENERLKAELAEAKKDAERYRFLRMQYMLIEFVIPDPERRVISVESFNTCTDDALALDAAIDAAMKGK